MNALDYEKIEDFVRGEEQFDVRNYISIFLSSKDVENAEDKAKYYSKAFEKLRKRRKSPFRYLFSINERTRYYYRKILKTTLEEEKIKESDFRLWLYRSLLMKLNISSYVNIRANGIDSLEALNKIDESELRKMGLLSQTKRAKVLGLYKKKDSIDIAAEYSMLTPQINYITFYLISLTIVGIIFMSFFDGSDIIRFYIGNNLVLKVTYISMIGVKLLIPIALIWYVIYNLGKYYDNPKLDDEDIYLFQVLLKTAFYLPIIIVLIDLIFIISHSSFFDNLCFSESGATSYFFICPEVIYGKIFLLFFIISIFSLCSFIWFLFYLKKIKREEINNEVISEESKSSYTEQIQDRLQLEKPKKKRITALMVGGIAFLASLFGFLADGTSVFENIIGKSYENDELAIIDFTRNGEQAIIIVSNRTQNDILINNFRIGELTYSSMYNDDFLLLRDSAQLNSKCLNPEITIKEHTKNIIPMQGIDTIVLNLELKNNTRNQCDFSIEETPPFILGYNVEITYNATHLINSTITEIINYENLALRQDSSIFNSLISQFRYGIREDKIIRKMKKEN